MKCLAAAAFALVLAGCSDTTACSLVGCVGEASVRLPDLSPALHYPLTVHGCFDDRCADMVVEQQPPAAAEQKVVPCQGQGRASCADLRDRKGYVEIVFGDPRPGSQKHTASVVVRDAGDAVVLRSTRRLTLEKLAPNGEKCGPICWSGAADFR